MEEAELAETVYQNALKVLFPDEYAL